MINREQNREKAIDFMYDFLNHYLRLDNGIGTMPNDIHRQTLAIKKNDLLRNDPMFNKAVSTITQLLNDIEETK